jgi:hypothetical protein
MVWNALPCSNTSEPRRAGRGVSKGKRRLYAPVKHFTELVGLEVRNFSNEELGKIKFITVDFENARVVDVVITSGGGFLGWNARITAVPPLALSMMPTVRPRVSRWARRASMPLKIHHV